MLPCSMEISGCKKRTRQYFSASPTFLASWCCLCCPLLCHVFPWLSEGRGFRGVLKSCRHLMNNKMESAPSQTLWSQKMPYRRLRHLKSPKFPSGKEASLFSVCTVWEGAVSSGGSPDGIGVVTSPRVTSFSPALSLLRPLGSFRTVPALPLHPVWLSFPRLNSGL